MTFARYKQNLRVVGDKVYSYNTHVADIKHDAEQVIVLGYWSMTTSKHIHYVARELKYQKVYSENQ